MFPLLKRRERKRAVGWGDELIIRPDTPLSAAQKKQLAKAIRRAKRDGKIAATAHQTIPYEEMYENGVCSLGNRLYSKSIAFEDRSYAEASDDDKAVIFELYCRLVNYFGPTVAFQLSVVCYYPDMAEYRKILRIPPTGDSFGSRVSSAFAEGWQNFVNGVQQLAVSLAGAWPVVVLAAAAVAGVAVWRKRKKKN